MRTLLAVLFFLASSAYGMVYTWTDSAGLAHYTNKEYEIPARYRTKVKALYPEQPDAAPAPQSGQTQQATPEGAPAAPQAKPEESQQHPVQTTIVPEQRKNAVEPVQERKRRRRVPHSGDN